MTQGPQLLPVGRITWAAALTGLVVYLLCILFHMIVPDEARVWLDLLPWFQWLTVGGFLVGLVDAVVIAGGTAWLFTVIYNGLKRSQ